MYAYACTVGILAQFLYKNKNIKIFKIFDKNNTGRCCNIFYIMCLIHYMGLFMVFNIPLIGDITAGMYAFIGQK